MEEEYKLLLEEAVLTAPLTLLGLEKEEDIKLVNEYLPYSTGFEIECFQKKINKEKISQAIDEVNFLYGKPVLIFNKYFTSIPNILDVDCDSGEQRFRIPNGINGLICLWNICEQLKLHSELNLGSGIHYHIDCTSSSSEIGQLAMSNPKWILEELETWDYKGKYNSKGTGWGLQWIRFNSLQTAEFRIGEMSFDYSLLVKRIIHCNKIVKRLKDELKIPQPIYQDLNRDNILEYLSSYTSYSKAYSKDKLKNLKEELRRLDSNAITNTGELTITEAMIKTINSRVVKINQRK